jgi:hypothetical protein
MTSEYVVIRQHVHMHTTCHHIVELYAMTSHTQVIMIVGSHGRQQEFR